MKNKKDSSFRLCQLRMRRSAKLSWEKRRCLEVYGIVPVGVSMMVCNKLKGHKGKHKAIIEWK